MQVLGSRILVAAFDGWNDAGEAASAAAEQIDDGGYDLVHAVDPELYFDYQWARPTLERDQKGNRSLRWPAARMQRPKGVADDAEPRLWLLTGTEPARAWQAFSAEFIDSALSEDITGFVTLGAMLSDVPHTRPISIFASSENAEVRDALGIERSSYEGPIGILSALDHAAEQAGIPALSLWANVPHYVQTGGASPKATLALLDRLHEVTGVDVPRGTLATEAAMWEATIDAAAAEDEEMAAYIAQLEAKRDTWDSPDASGEAIAQAFERFFRRNGEGPGDHKR
ncbi:PAC2 family protein [Microbacterium azadirachtae]|uniref:PAC2 family protein n=1 Tax=Microbacterium azadirachtae TaxID=582680 RepID=UPI000889C5CD|nr:PAC2 family protein [Microbacterium azadirachtae]SDL24306.1 PAC2 family protein [Microbacterium azadirachtae]SEF54195.1 PAC2 family protein [Microbacterium azadirachtae]SEF54453.1 PAC2 family protein [Microbacterium azadirachtae]